MVEGNKEEKEMTERTKNDISMSHIFLRWQNCLNIVGVVTFYILLLSSIQIKHEFRTNLWTLILCTTVGTVLIQMRFLHEKKYKLYVLSLFPHLLILILLIHPDNGLGTLFSFGIYFLSICLVLRTVESQRVTRDSFMAIFALTLLIIPGFGFGFEWARPVRERNHIESITVEPERPGANESFEIIVEMEGDLGYSVIVEYSIDGMENGTENLTRVGKWEYSVRFDGFPSGTTFKFRIKAFEENSMYEGERRGVSGWRNIAIP